MRISSDFTTPHFANCLARKSFIMSAWGGLTSSRRGATRAWCHTILSDLTNASVIMGGIQSKYYDTMPLCVSLIVRATGRAQFACSVRCFSYRCNYAVIALKILEIGAWVLAHTNGGLCRVFKEFSVYGWGGPSDIIPLHFVYFY